jgi:hypothetical protein
MGRALPEAGKSMEEKSLSEHREALTGEPCAIPINVLEDITSWTTKVVGVCYSKLRRDHPEETFSPPSWTPNISSSACIERSRELGGSQSYVKDACKQFCTCSERDPKTDAKITATVVRYGWNLLTRMQPLPVGKVMSVAAPGYKCRVLAKHHAAHTTVAQAFNRTLIRLLKRWRPATGALRGREIHRDFDVMNLYNTRSLEQGAVLYSGDLKSASDYIPFSVARAIVDGVCKALSWDDDAKDLLYRLTGPYELTYPSGDVIETKRGELMGVATTWPILSLLNGFCAEHGSRRTQYGKTGGRPAYRICGDDIIALWSKEHIKQYRKNLSTVGLVENKSKTLFSRTEGVFTEQYVRLERAGFPSKDTTPWYELENAHGLGILPDTPVKLHTINRALLSTILMAKAVNATGRAKDATLPLFVTLGDATQCVHCMGCKDWREERAIKLMLKLHTGAVSTLHRAGLPLFLPKGLGGAGLYSKKLDAPAEMRRHMSWLISALPENEAQREAAQRQIRRVAGCWRATTIDPSLRSAMANVQYKLDALPRAQHGKAPLLKNFEKRVLGGALAAAMLDPTMGATSSKVCVKAKPLGRKVSHIIGSWPRRANAVEPNKLVQRLDALHMFDERVRKNEADTLWKELRAPRVVIPVVVSASDTGEYQGILSRIDRITHVHSQPKQTL